MRIHPLNETVRWGIEQLRAAGAPRRDLALGLRKLRARHKRWLLNGIEPIDEGTAWGLGLLRDMGAPKRDVPQGLARLQAEFARRQQQDDVPLGENAAWGVAQLQQGRAPKRDLVAGLGRLHALADERAREPLPTSPAPIDPLAMFEALRAPKRDLKAGWAKLQALAQQRAAEGEQEPSEHVAWGIAQLQACRAPERDVRQGLAKLHARQAERSRASASLALVPAATAATPSTTPTLAAEPTTAANETQAPVPRPEKHKAELRVVRGEKKTKAKKATPGAASSGLWWKTGIPLVALAAAAALVVGRQEPEHNTTSPGAPQLHCPPFEGPDRPPDTLGTEDERGRIFQLRHLVEDEAAAAREDIAAAQKRDDPSVLSDEREALAVHVELCLSKAPRTEARRRGEAFLQRYPQSPWAAAIRRELRSPPEPYR